VLFGLEELGRFADEAGTMWRAFVTSVLAAVALQYLDPFGTARLVLFQATAASDAWRAFELVPWTLLGVIGVSPARRQ
jgi:chloride channel 3/4/5